MDCTQCGEQSKYKCPVCRQPYCSVGCCKLHKKSQCEPPHQASQMTQEECKTTYDFPTEATVPCEKLKLLGKNDSIENSTELRKCLENPHVRELLTKLDKSSHPDTLINKYMQEPIFTEFVDACLNVVQTEEKVYK